MLRGLTELGSHHFVTMEPMVGKGVARMVGRNTSKKPLDSNRTQTASLASFNRSLNTPTIENNPIKGNFPSTYRDNATITFFYNKISDYLSSFFFADTPEIPGSLENSSYKFINSSPFVQKVKSNLETHASAIVTGAPSSGKTELLTLALDKKSLTLDLKNIFMESYFKENNIVDKEQQDNIWKNEYPHLKKEESDWLNKNAEIMTKKLIDSKEKIIIFDEFDLSSGELNADEFNTAMTIMEISEKVKASGKTVIFIMHSEGLRDEDLIQAMEEKGLFHKDTLISTSFFDKKTEMQLLESLGFSPSAQEVISRHLEGFPAPYLPILQHILKVKKGETQDAYTPTPEEFLKLAHSKTGRLYKIIKDTESKEVINLLQKIAANGIESEDGEELKKYQNHLIGTGLLSLTEKGLFMPLIVKEIIINESKITKVQESLESIEKLLGKSGSPVYQKTMDYYRKIGFPLTTTTDGKFTTNYKHLVSLLAEINRKEISDALDIKEFPKEEISALNSATSPTQLIDQATKASAPFLEMIKETCSKSGARYFMGDNNEFMIKELSSLERKVITRANIAGTNIAYQVQNIGDALRGTIICDNTKEMKDAIHGFYEFCKQKNIPVQFVDKFKDNYPGGYVGVHCYLYFPVDSDNNIFSEIQFHIKTVHDGTVDSTKEVAHNLYSFIRSNQAEEEVKNQMNIMSSLLFAASIGNQI